MCEWEARSLDRATLVSRKSAKLFPTQNSACSPQPSSPVLGFLDLIRACFARLVERFFAGRQRMPDGTGTTIETAAPVREEAAREARAEPTGQLSAKKRK